VCDGAVYRAVVIARLLYASPAWCMGYSSTSDKQRIEAFIHWGVKLGFYGTGDTTAHQLADAANENCCRQWDRESTTCFITASQTPSASATLFGPSDITLYLKQQLMTILLLLDSCLESSIDILFCFYCTLIYCNQSRYAQLRLKLLIDWLIATTLKYWLITISWNTLCSKKRETPNSWQ